MNFKRFMAQSLDQFAAVYRREGRSLLFHHIPKTAGSSLTRELSLTLPPYRNIHVDRSLPDVPEMDSLTVAFETFVADDATTRFQSASGHLRPPHVRQMRTLLPHFATFTVLRDPVARVVSEYRYSRTPKHPPFESFIARFPTIEAYVESERDQNKMWRLMGGRDVSDEGIERVFSNYLFIGLVEDLQLHFEVLTALGGYPKTISSRANVTQKNSDNDITMTPELISFIEQNNAADMALYTAVRDGLAARRDEMVAFVEARRAVYGGPNA